MAKGDWGKKGKGGARAGGKGADDSKANLKIVDEWNHMSKKLVKAYPHKDAGGFIKHGGKKQFKLEAQKEWIDPVYSELAARTAQGVNLHMSTIAEALPAVEAAGSGDSCTGFRKLAELFPEETIRPLVALAQVDSEGDKDDRVKAVKKLLEMAADEEDADAKFKALAAVADTATRLWAFTTSWAQLMGHAQNLKHWAENVAKPEYQHKALKDWLKKPKQLDKLAEAVVEAYEDRFYWGGKKAKRKTYGKSEESDEKAKDSSSDSSSSDSKKKKKRKSKKSKKAQKKKKRSTSSSSESPKKKVKKDKKKKKSSSGGSSDAKKAKKDKKKSKKASSSSSSDSDKKAKEKRKAKDAKKENKRKADSGDESDQKPEKTRKGAVEKEKTPWESWGRPSVKLFRQTLSNFDWGLERSNGEDFAGLVAVPPTALMTKFWSELSDIKLSDPDIKSILEDFLSDPERKKHAKKQFERLADEAEKQLGLQTDEAAGAGGKKDAEGAAGGEATPAAPASGAADAGGAPAAAAEAAPEAKPSGPATPAPKKAAVAKKAP